MNSETINQANIFLIFIIIGFLIGFLFDIFRILRKSFKTISIVTYFEDILFWIITTLMIMYSIFVFNNGQFRGYIFIGIILGLSIYVLIFSRFLVKILTSIIIFLKMIFISLLKIIYYPFKKLGKYLKHSLYILITKFKKVFKNILKNKNKNGKILQNKEGF